MSTSWSSAQAGRFDGRTRDDGDALKRSAQLGQTITPLLMDVTNAEQIGAALESVAAHVGSGGLNALVDNAGIGLRYPRNSSRWSPCGGSWRSTWSARSR